MEEPLFLDCCALVRRCVKDLRMDFGFQLKGGNQAYQFDTLPMRVDNITDVRAASPLCPLLPPFRTTQSLQRSVRFGRVITVQT